MLLGLILFGFTLTMGLLPLGEKGNTAAGPLSLLVAIIALGLAILFRPGSRSVPRPRVDRRAVVIVASVLVLMVGAALGVTYVYVIHKTDLEVTDALRITGEPDGDGQRWTVTAEGQSSGRQKLRLTPHLTNASTTGNCVGPTQLRVRPVRNGAIDSALPQLYRNSDPISMDVRDAGRPGAVIETVGETSGCELGLGFDEAVLYKNFPW